MIFFTDYIMYKNKIVDIVIYQWKYLFIRFFLNYRITFLWSINKTNSWQIYLKKRARTPLLNEAISQKRNHMKYIFEGKMSIKEKYNITSFN